VARVSICPQECAGGSEADLPKVIFAIEPSVSQRADVPPVSKDVDQVDACGRQRIEVAEGEPAHSGTIGRCPALLGGCHNGVERRRRIGSEEVACWEYRSVCLA